MVMSGNHSLLDQAKILNIDCSKIVVLSLVVEDGFCLQRLDM
jgi:hypothetical protein